MCSIIVAFHVCTTSSKDLWSFISTLNGVYKWRTELQQLSQDKQINGPEGCDHISQLSTYCSEPEKLTWLHFLFRSKQVKQGLENKVTSSFTGLALDRIIIWGKSRERGCFFLAANHTAYLSLEDSVFTVCLDSAFFSHRFFLWWQISGWFYSAGDMSQSHHRVFYFSHK